MLNSSCLKLIGVPILGAFAWLAASAAGAATLAQPAGKPILAISGKISSTNDGANALFDRAMLESLGMTSFVTKTPWYKEPSKFEGVPLEKLMSAVGASGDRIVVVALNDYSAELPMEDAKKYNVILALKRDGEYMGVRDKGPLFIVYPFDSDPDLQTLKFYTRSVWQIARIEIK
ncbi:MAG: molybdopterin-dependent oxidoreductase [Bradyrhizobium sp.]|jgi:hypothetical protein